MRRILKWLTFLAGIGFLTVLGYAVFGDLSAPQSEISKEITLEVD